MLSSEHGALMGTPKLLLVVAGALVDPDGRVMLSRRPAHKAHGGLWEFPGGKVEPGESPQAALVRELREELRVEPCEQCLQPFAFASEPMEGGYLLMPLFVCRKWDGFPDPQEGQTIAWVRPNDLLKYDMPPADKPLAAELRDRLHGTRQPF
ncbi:(deoxy)nucleoside triphosphate pyrophosphohydrolase [Woodsholea maritima]|uniref:(deoxy)nucleoside triphosphate pyrophosphohydrolase n=1 Tax=Woodsholea maritima TaxID=240237 RepID=UPI000361F469